MKSDPVYVQYGCGWSAPDGWLNFDSSPTLRFERMPLLGKLYTRNQQRFPEAVRYGDVTRSLPVAAGVADLVYCSHVLEHLALDEFRFALRETMRILRQGGTFRLVLPDLEASINDYIASTDASAASRFLESTMLGYKARPRNPAALFKEWLGGSRHLWMWDFKALKSELEDAGFVAVRRARFGDSMEQAFAAVEEEGRWTGCLGAEAKTPEP